MTILKEWFNTEKKNPKNIYLNYSFLDFIKLRKTKFIL